MLKAQTISFTAPATPVSYGVAPIALVASATSGLAVTFSVTSGPATVSGSTLTITGTGTVVVAAKQAGNGTYAAAPTISKSIVVNRATLTVTANNAGRAYGAANPTFTPSYSGFLNGDTATVLTGAPSLTTTATASSTAGGYPITAAAGTLAAANYSFAYVNGTLTVGKAVLTVTANNASRAYGAANPGFTPSYSGFLNGDTASVLTGAPSFTTTAAAPSAVGSYPITPTVGTLAAANYNFSFVNGTLTVGKAVLTVTANNASRAYGAANPGFTPSYSGFLNGDTASVLTGTPSLTTAATAPSAVGSYSITPTVGTLAAANYNFSFVNGTLTVGKAVLTVTANNASRAYGAANPGFTPSYSGFLNGDTASVLTGTPSLTTAATAPSAVGSYSITPTVGTLAAANYNFSFVNGTLTVGKAVLTVTANNASRAYGAANPGFTPSYSGFLNGDTASVLTGTPSLTTAATASSTVGSYTITAAGGTLAAANYSFTYVNGTLMVTPGVGMIATVAGSGTYGGGNSTGGYSGDGGAAVNATMMVPFSVAVDTAGNFYFADSKNNVVRKVAASSGIITTVAGNGTAGSSGNNVPATAAELNFPNGVAVDSSGNLYIADTLNYAVRKVTFNSSGAGTITTVAGTPGVGGAFYTGIGGPATSATFPIVEGVSVDITGNIYISTWSAILEVPASSGNISVVAGTVTTGTGPGGAPLTSGYCGFTGDGGPATSAEIAAQGLATDQAGNLYFADPDDNRIRKVTFNNGVGTITTVAGSGANSGGGNGCNAWVGGYSGDDGLATGAELNSPQNVAVDASGNLYIADSANNVIRKVFADNQMIVTVAGNGTAGYIGDGGLAVNAELSGTDGVAVNASGTAFYIADAQNNRIREAGSSKTAPIVTWAPLAPITYGTPLSSTQLNASSSPLITGPFAYTPASGTVLSAGSQTLSVTLAPTDTADFATATATNQLTVNPVAPVISWATPAAIPYGTALSTTQFNATATGVNGVSLPGTFAYAPALGTVLTAEPHTLTVTFTPNDSIDYVPVIAQVTEIVAPVSGTRADTGTVTLSVNSGAGYVAAASYSYGANDTPSSVAEGLAGNVVSGSPVNVTAVDDAVYIEAIATGTPLNSTNYPYNLSATNANPTLFPEPSFVSSSISGKLDGGTNQQTTGTGATVYSFNGSYDFTGNLTSYTDFVMGTWNFSNASGSGYDTLNRLSLATQTPVSGSPLSFCWSYDAFGNRTAQATSSQPFTNSAGASACEPAANATLLSNFWSNPNTNNQITGTPQAVGGLTYDASGGLLNDGLNQYLYDGDGQICAVASTPMPGMTVMTGYLYDAGGTRVAKGSITSWSCDPTVNGFQTTNDYILGPGGEQVTEMGVGGTTSSGETSGLVWQHTNIWAGGKLLGTYDGGRTTETASGDTTVVTTYGLHFYFNDPLGTRRSQTDYAGVLEQTCSSLPFGDQLACTGSTIAPTEHHFAGKERDTESGNDYFGARYYASSMGRFLSPDWSVKITPVPYAKLSDPQSLNLYSYVLNNPLSHADADGHWIQLTGDDEARKKQLDALKSAVGSKAGAYLYDNTVDGKHYVGVLSGGADGKGPSFGSINKVSEKIGDIIGDTGRGATIQFVSPGTSVNGHTVGSMDAGQTPAVTAAARNGNWATISVTSGPFGELNGDMSSNGHSLATSLADILSHELGHVDASWYHGGIDTNGDAVRMENTTRQIEGGSTRLGHDTPRDVRLGATTY